jgi:hypothetical protein
VCIYRFRRALVVCIYFNIPRFLSSFLVAKAPFPRPLLLTTLYLPLSFSPCCPAAMYCTFPRHHDVVRRGCARCADGWRLDVAGARGCLDSGLQAQVRAGLYILALPQEQNGQWQNGQTLPMILTTLLLQ